MAFDPTDLLRATATIAQASTFSKNNLRVPYYGAAAALLGGADTLIRGLGDLKTSSAQPLSIPVFNKVPAGTGTLRKCAGSGDGATALVPVVYEGITEEFNLNDLDTQGNSITRDAAFAYLVQQKASNIYKRIDDKALAFLEANKATVNNGTYFDAGAGGAKQVPYDQRLEFFAGVQAEQGANSFTGITDIVGGYNLKAIYDLQRAQGTGNAVNSSYQTDNYNTYFTNVPNGVGVRDTAYVFESGTVGAFPWLRPDFRRTKDIGTDVWMTYRLPPMFGMAQGLEVELKVKYGCQGEAEYTESYVMHIDIAFLSAYAQTTGDSGVYKLEILKP
jgi:hypothetical protein